jgi:hypothetical protein
MIAMKNRQERKTRSKFKSDRLSDQGRSLLVQKHLFTIMDRLIGTQLSLIADKESPYQYADWAIDTSCPAPANRSSHGGQNKNSPVQIAPHDGGQTVESVLEAAPHHGGQNKNSLFDKSEGDAGTWTEIEHRTGGDYKYLRWRECSGKKRSKYLGKVSI